MTENKPAQGLSSPDPAPHTEPAVLSYTLPDGWFGIDDPEIVRRLKQAVKDFTTRHGRDPRVTSWAALLLLLWRRDVIELRGRRRDFPDGPPSIIDYPLTERFWHPEHGFDIAYGRLLHRPSVRVYYAVEVRVRIWGLVPPSFRPVTGEATPSQPIDNPSRGFERQQASPPSDRPQPDPEPAKPRPASAAAVKAKVDTLLKANPGISAVKLWDAVKEKPDPLPGATRQQVRDAIPKDKKLDPNRPRKAPAE